MESRGCTACEAVGFRLSSFNLEAFSDLKCMRAIDAQWRAPQWKRNVLNSTQSRYPTRVAGKHGGRTAARCHNKLGATTNGSEFTTPSRCDDPLAARR